MMYLLLNPKVPCLGPEPPGRPGAGRKRGEAEGDDGCGAGMQKFIFLLSLDVFCKKIICKTFFK